jgi:hypothetical protein
MDEQEHADSSAASAKAAVAEGSAEARQLNTGEAILFQSQDFSIYSHTSDRSIHRRPGHGRR